MILCLYNLKAFKKNEIKRKFVIKPLLKECIHMELINLRRWQACDK